MCEVAILSNRQEGSHLGMSNNKEIAVKSYDITLISASKVLLNGRYVKTSLLYLICLPSLSICNVSHYMWSLYLTSFYLSFQSLLELFFIGVLVAEYGRIHIEFIDNNKHIYHIYIVTLVQEGVKTELPNW